MINKELLRQKLLEGFALYQYRLERPFPPKTHMTELDAAKFQFQTDSVFNGKVYGLTMGVMRIIDEVEQCSSE